MKIWIQHHPGKIKILQLAQMSGTITTKGWLDECQFFNVISRYSSLVSCTYLLHPIEIRKQKDLVKASYETYAKQSKDTDRKFLGSSWNCSSQTVPNSNTYTRCGTWAWTIHAYTIRWNNWHISPSY